MTTLNTPRPPASRNHGHRPDDPPLIDARAVSTLLREHPQLHLYGYGPHPVIDIEPGAYTELMTPSCRVRIAAARAWVEANLVPARRGNRKQARSTYSLKAVMQRDTGLYVYNGEFAAAALLSHISVDVGYFNPLVFATLNPDTRRAGGDDHGATDRSRR